MPPPSPDSNLKRQHASGCRCRTRSAEQEITIVAQPKEAKLTTEKKYGNQMFYLEAKANADGKIPLEMVLLVKRKEVKGVTKDATESTAKLVDFLQADAKVPIAGKPLDLIKGKQLPTDQTEAARVMYDVVNAPHEVQQGRTRLGPRRFGVGVREQATATARDFHSLFISLARADKIPAKFEIGFSLPEKHGAGDVAGYHCWAKFRPTARAGCRWTSPRPTSTRR